MTPNLPAVGRARVVVLLGALVGAPIGCRSYEARPLDLRASRDEWLSRSPGDRTVRDLAASLAAQEGVPPGEFDADDGLSLAEGEVVALVFNPDLRLARLQARVTRAEADHAGLWADPVFGVDMERIVSGAGGEPWVVGAALGFTLPVSGRLESEKARAGAAAHSALVRIVALEWATRAALRTLWIDWSAAGLRAEATAGFVERLREMAELADRQERAGSITRVEARLLAVALAAGEAELIAARGRESERRLQILALLGLAPDVSFVMLPAVVVAPRVRDAAELRAQMEVNSPELNAVRSEYAVAEESLRTEVRKQFPDITIGPGYAADQGDDRVLLGISLPVPLWNRNRQGVAVAEAEREVARAKFSSTYEHLAARLAAALKRYETGRDQRAAIEGAVVPMADEQLAEVSRIAALGRIDPLLLLGALSAQHDARLRLIEARAAESIGAVRLDELIGPAAPPPTEGQASDTTVGSRS
ncbi:MAG TPA: hypothetical protein DEB06_02945 [Phycisphaerales bacterium]|nr:hypothetical protein [Phycisphaerales bacterium]